jgi:hypothetical protein
MPYRDWDLTPGQRWCLRFHWRFLCGPSRIRGQPWTFVCRMPEFMTMARSCQDKPHPEPQHEEGRCSRPVELHDASRFWLWSVYSVRNGWTAAPGAAQARAVLESSVLRVEITSAPYSYAVIEKKTGQILSETGRDLVHDRCSPFDRRGRCRKQISERARGHAQLRRIRRHRARPVGPSPIPPWCRCGEPRQSDQHHRGVRRSRRAQLRPLGIFLLRHRGRARQTAAPTIARCSDSPGPRSAAAIPAGARRSI